MNTGGVGEVLSVVAAVLLFTAIVGLWSTSSDRLSVARQRLHLEATPRFSLECKPVAGDPESAQLTVAFDGPVSVPRLTLVAISICDDGDHGQAGLDHASVKSVVWGSYRFDAASGSDPAGRTITFSDLSIGARRTLLVRRTARPPFLAESDPDGQLWRARYEARPMFLTIRSRARGFQPWITTHTVSAPE